MELNELVKVLQSEIKVSILYCACYCMSLSSP